MHAPGLKVVAPSTPDDANGLLTAGDPRPQPGRLPRAQEPLPPDQGRGARRSTRPSRSSAPRRARGRPTLTVDRLRRDGPRGARGRRALDATASVEVLDLRSLVPLDEEAILASVAQDLARSWSSTRPTATCAAGAEVAALIADRGFEDLDGPVRRLATPDVPIPFSPPLEQAVLPGRASDRGGAALSSSATEPARWSTC